MCYINTILGKNLDDPGSVRLHPHIFSILGSVVAANDRFKALQEGRSCDLYDYKSPGYEQGGFVD